MPSLKDIKNRISSVKSTQQITKAMKMVSAAKFRKAEEAMLQNRPYSDKILEVLSSLSLRTEAARHPLLERRDPRSVLLVVFTSDRGLCGSFNGSIIRSVDRFLKEKKHSYDRISLYLVGKKAREFFKTKNVDILGEKAELFGKVSFGTAQDLAAEIVERYTNREFDLVYMVYNEFRSALSQQVVYDRLLPVEPAGLETESSTAEYLYEPTEEHMLDWLLPRYVDVRLYRALLESTASEHGARMTAMDSATNNASDMIARLSLKYNRARQDSITRELMDIVNGVESMR